VSVAVGASWAAVSVVVPQPDGRILIGGDFDVVNGTPRHFLARLLQDGSLDERFDAHISEGWRVNDIAVQPDGRIIFGGYLTNVADTLRVGLARVEADGTLDSAYNPGVSGTIGFGGGPATIALQPDGKLLV